MCFCLSQSTSKWQIIMCLCQEGPTTTTMPMWNLFLTLLNAYLFRYCHIPHSIPKASAQQLIIYFLSLNKYLFCVSYRQFGLAGVMPQRTPNSQSCFTKMALPSWVKDISSLSTDALVYLDIIMLKYLIYCLLCLQDPQVRLCGL